MERESCEILPTGKGAGAMSGARHDDQARPGGDLRQISFTYRSFEEVEQTLKHAEEIRRQGKEHEAKAGAAVEEEETGADDDEELVYDITDEKTGETVDVEMTAHMVCDMIGGPDGDDELVELNTKEETAFNLIRDYEGPFELKPHQWALLGRRRDMTVEAPTFAEIAEQLNIWLTMFTVGKWSNWALIMDVQIVLPSASASLTLADVPGFGLETSDVFRQSIVTEAIRRC